LDKHVLTGTASAASLGKDGNDAYSQLNLAASTQKSALSSGVIADVMGGITNNATADTKSSMSGEEASSPLRPAGNTGLALDNSSGLTNPTGAPPATGSASPSMSAELQAWNQAVTRKESGEGGEQGARNVNGINKGESGNVLKDVNVLNSPLSPVGNPTSSTPQGLNQGMSGAGHLVSEGDSVFKAQFERASVESFTEAGGDGLEESSHPKTNDTAATKFSELQTKVNGSQSRQYASTLNTHVGDPEWGAELNQKIIWMSGRGIQSAELHLNPADLGPVEVRISVQNDQTVVSFNSQNAGVREMLESNVQRLRDMMDHNGVELTDVSVDSETANNNAFASKQGGSDGNSPDSDLGRESQGTDNEEILATEQNLKSLGLVDFYA